MLITRCQFVAGLILAMSLGMPRLALSGDTVEFRRDVQVLLEQKCVRCHGEGTSKGELSFATRAAALKGGESGAAIVAGKPQESLLLDMVGGESPSMPKQAAPLSADEVITLRRWIEQGAAWPDELVLAEQAPQNRDWWSLQPVKRSLVPEVADVTWPRNAIDRFVLAALEKRGLAPSPPADARTLLRRLNFDLWGLPPSRDEVINFADSADSQAYEKLVEEKLQSIHFGERFAQHWLDVVRYSETNGFEMNQERPNAWPYRDYVVRAFQNDLPYDRFLKDQLAGDQSGTDAATGYLVAGPWDQVRSPDPVLTANQRADEMHDIVSTVGSSLLGLTVGCARCHNHKFDPIPQVDYYAVKAIFAGVEHGERDIKATPTAEQLQNIALLRSQEQAVGLKLRAYEPLATATPLVCLPSDSGQLTQLVPTEGREPYAAGVERGQASFPGDSAQLPTIGQGYLYWHNVAGKDVASWSPNLEGNIRIWVSWGGGWTTHATDARYLLDADGDLSTIGDQQSIGQADHHLAANGDSIGDKQPRWSGLRNLGVHKFGPSSKLVLRGGDSNAYVSADLMVFEPTNDEAQAGNHPALRAPVTRGTNIERFEPQLAKFVRFTVLATSQAEPCIDELEVFTAGNDSRNVALAGPEVKLSASGTYPNSEIHRLEHLNDGKYGNSRSWISNEAGRGWVQIEWATPANVDTITWGRDQSDQPQFADRLATQYKIELSLDGSTWTCVATAADRLPPGTPLPGRLFTPAVPRDAYRQLEIEQQSLLEKLRLVTQPKLVYAGRLNAMPAATPRLHRGDPTQPREAIPPGGLSALGITLEVKPDATDAERRSAFATWVVSKQNPLTARVMVNRLWQWHFGVGLVDTPSDFGVNGARPTYPELLDYLAAELMDHDWSLRHVHRLIVTSATYRQASVARAEGLAQDAGDRYLWRYPPRRLEAEQLRDAMLAASGKLDLTPGGVGFDTFVPNANYVRVYTPKSTFTAADFRRLLYAKKVRMHVDPVFGVFDCPDGGQVAPKRTQSTTPLQALNLLNSSFVIGQSQAFADRVKAEASDDIAAQVSLAFEIAYQRQPNAAEAHACQSIVHDQGLFVLCRALLNSNEFLFVD